MMTKAAPAGPRGTRDKALEICFGFVSIPFSFLYFLNAGLLQPQAGEFPFISPPLSETPGQQLCQASDSRRNKKYT